jgi:hypothetical protein
MASFYYSLRFLRTSFVRDASEKFGWVWIETDCDSVQTPTPTYLEAGWVRVDIHFLSHSHPPFSSRPFRIKHVYKKHQFFALN